MRVGLERQTEVPKVFRVVIGLRHGAQGRYVDDLVMVGALGLLQQPVEVGCLQDLPLGELHA